MTPSEQARPPGGAAAAARAGRAPGDRILRAGLAVTAAGLVCTVVAVSPLLFSDLHLPGAWWFLSMLTAVGLVVVFVGLVVAARDRGRQVQAAAGRPAGGPADRR